MLASHTRYIPATETPASRSAPAWCTSVTVYVCDCPRCWGFDPDCYEDDDEGYEDFGAYTCDTARELAEGYAIVVQQFVPDFWPHLDLRLHVGEACSRHRTATVHSIGDEIERVVESLGGEDQLQSGHPLKRYWLATTGYVPPDYDM